MEFTEELKAGLDKVKVETKELVTTEITAAMQGVIKVEDLTEKLEALKVDGLTIKELVEAVTKQGEQVKKLTESQSAPTKGESLSKVIEKAHGDFAKSNAMQMQGDKFSFKIPITALKTTIGLSSITNDPFGLMLPDFGRIASQNNTIAPSLNTIPIGADSHGTIIWVDQSTRTNNAAARADGNAAAEQVYAWTKYSQALENISAKVPVHLEMLKHVSIMEGEIKALLNDDLSVKEDGYLYTGTNVTPQIGGLYTRATAFGAAAYIAAGGYTPKFGNIYDLIMAMAAQIMKATKYRVDRAWVNPYDLLAMKLDKDNEGRYTMPPFVVRTANGDIAVDSMQIVASNSVTANTLVVGDSTRARRYVGDNIEITMGYDTSGDFSKRIITLLANMEVLLLIRNVEADAFLKSESITADITAITASGA